MPAAAGESSRQAMASPAAPTTRPPITSAGKWRPRYIVRGPSRRSMRLPRRTATVSDETRRDPGPMPRSLPRARRETRSRQPARKCQCPSAAAPTRRRRTFGRAHRRHADEAMQMHPCHYRHRIGEDNCQHQRHAESEPPSKSAHDGDGQTARHVAQKRHRPHDLGQPGRCPLLKPQNESSVEHRPKINLRRYRGAT